MKEATLCYFIDTTTPKHKVLLGKKLRGKDEGKFNGYGGKKEDKDVTLLACLIRECGEEVGILPLKPTARGKIQYEFFVPGVEGKQVLTVYVFTTETWQGDPTASDEMEPHWFTLDTIPWEDMQENDRLWLETLLTTDQEIDAFLTFDINGTQLPESYIRWE